MNFVFFFISLSTLPLGFCGVCFAFAKLHVVNLYMNVIRYTIYVYIAIRLVCILLVG